MPSSEEEFVMSSHFDERAAVHHDDPVRALDRREAVRDNQGRSVLH